MKRIILSLFFAVMAAMTVNAQQIAVVSGGGATNVYQTLAEAIEGAEPGSTIYLPGGGFQISDDVKITKRLSIIGIGHKAVSENADGNTVISGNIFFNNGSDNSGIMGCYISGNVKIGYDESSVNNIIIKYCNLNAVEVQNNTCTGTVVSQNYIRNTMDFSNANGIISNNIMHSIKNINGGKIANNVIVSVTGSTFYKNNYINNSTVSNNVFIFQNYINVNYTFRNVSGDNNIGLRNLVKSDWGDEPINIGDTDWNDVFADYNNGAITPASNFHFKGEFLQYEDEIGIYGGTTPFNDSALPPVPYIVSKVIPEQTDASGKLNIKIRVKAGD